MCQLGMGEAIAVEIRGVPEKVCRLSFTEFFVMYLVTYSSFLE